MLLQVLMFNFNKLLTLKPKVMEDQYQYSVEQWWLNLTAGIAFIIIGAVIVFYPATSYSNFTTIFMVGFGVVGLLETYYALSNRKQLQHWGWTLMCGLIDLSLMFLLMTSYNIDVIGLAVYVGFILFFRSIVGVGFSTYLKQFKVRNWVIVLFLSVLGIVFAIMAIWETRVGVLNLTINTTLALLTVGFAQVGIAYELRRHENLLGGT